MHSRCNYKALDEVIWSSLLWPPVQRTGETTSACSERRIKRPVPPSLIRPTALSAELRFHCMRLLDKETCSTIYRAVLRVRAGRVGPVPHTISRRLH
jgi:hypothetical protein